MHGVILFMNPYFDKFPKEQKIQGNWILTLEEYKFHCSKDFAITIPKYSLSDGPSIPPVLMWLLTRPEIYFSGIAHDYLRSSLDLSNRGIDGIFYDMCFNELPKNYSPLKRKIK